MLVTFTIPTQPAGSIGGLTLYKYGDSFAGRARVMPTKVRSAAHTAAMDAISTLSMWWEHPLTNADRAAWGTYAFNSPLTDAYGAPKYIRGYASFLRSNRPRYLAGLPIIEPGPTTFGLPPYTLPTFATDFTTRTVTITVNPADTWAQQNAAMMFLWASRPTTPSRRRPPETYRFLGFIPGNAATPPTSATFTLPPWMPPKKLAYWIRSSVSDQEGRLSGL